MKIQMLNDEQIKTLIKVLQTRFEQNLNRHKGIEWSNVQEKLVNKPDKLKSLFEMERTNGEPDVIGFYSKENVYIFCDCSEQSPDGRRSLCFDQMALDDRKTNKPKNSACEMAKEMGIQILNEEDYRNLQQLGKFDTKTSSWIETPSEIRKLGGALFCDRRYDTVFTYHNGADSYYASRGFRGFLKI